MTTGAVDDAVAEDDLVRLRAPVRRYLARTVTDEHELDDLVQETLLRVWEVRGRVDRGVAAAYAVAIARNLVQSRQRAEHMQARHAHRLHEPVGADGPEQVALRKEERVAVTEALTQLQRGDRELLAQEYGDGTAPERSARHRSRLARARGRARVDYLLRLRRLELPTAACRPVLDALSCGDRRDQQRAGAGGHLAGCRTCADCAAALLSRRRGLFGVVAVPLLVLLEAVRRAPRSTASVAAGTAAVVAVVVVVGQHQPPAPAVAASPAAATPGPVELLADGGFAPAIAGEVSRPVVARDVLVRSVPADEGFWVGPDDTHQLFVQLTGVGESPEQVRPGARVSFAGTVEALVPGVDLGVDEQEGRALLRAQGAYLVVPVQGLVLR